MLMVCGSFADLIGQRIFGGDAGLRIELADQAEIVAGEPDIAVFVFGEPVRAAVRRLQGVFADRAGLRVDAAELVGELPGPPDRAVFGCARIVRARAFRRHVPQIDARLHGAGNDHRARPLPLGKILHEVFRHRRPFFGGNGRVHVLHHAHDREPAFRRVADAHAVDVVAAPQVSVKRCFIAPSGQSFAVYCACAGRACVIRRA